MAYTCPDCRNTVEIPILRGEVKRKSRYRVPGPWYLFLTLVHFSSLDTFIIWMSHVLEKTGRKECYGDEVNFTKKF